MCQCFPVDSSAHLSWRSGKRVAEKKFGRHFFFSAAENSGKKFGRRKKGGKPDKIGWRGTKKKVPITLLTPLILVTGKNGETEKMFRRTKFKFRTRFRSKFIVFSFERGHRWLLFRLKSYRFNVSDLRNGTKYSPNAVFRMIWRKSILSKPRDCLVMFWKDVLPILTLN